MFDCIEQLNIWWTNELNTTFFNIVVLFFFHFRPFYGSCLEWESPSPALKHICYVLCILFFPFRCWVLFLLPPVLVCRMQRLYRPQTISQLNIWNILFKDSTAFGIPYAAQPYFKRIKHFIYFFDKPSIFPMSRWWNDSVLRYL